jgi:D-psicose/D-tagatose/L-ribulose 3-epimerase
VRVVCEIVNRYETAMMNTATRGMEFAALSGSEHLLLHLDTFHMNIEERDPLTAVRIALPRLAYLEIGQNDRGELRGGRIDLQAFVRDAVHAGYRGRWGVEAFSASVLSPSVAQALAIWRTTFGERNDIAVDAADIFRTIAVK